MLRQLSEEEIEEHKTELAEFCKGNQAEMYNYMKELKHQRWLTLEAVLALLDAKITETDKQIKRASEAQEIIALPTLCALKVVLRELRAEVEGM